MVLPDQFMSGILADRAEPIVDVGNRALNVGHRHDGMLIQSELLTGQLVQRRFFGGEALFKSVFRPLAPGNVAGNLRRPNNRALAVLNRRNRHRDLNCRAIFANPDSFEIIQPLPAANSRQNGGFLIREVGRQQHSHGPAHRLGRRIAKQPLGARIPRGDCSVQALANDRVTGRLNHRRQVLAHFINSLTLGDFLFQPSIDFSRLQ